MESRSGYGAFEVFGGLLLVQDVFAYAGVRGHEDGGVVQGVGDALVGREEVEVERGFVPFGLRGGGGVEAVVEGGGGDVLGETDGGEGYGGGVEVGAFGEGGCNPVVDVGDAGEPAGCVEVVGVGTTEALLFEVGGRFGVAGAGDGDARKFGVDEIPSGWHNCASYCILRGGCRSNPSHDALGIFQSSQDSSQRCPFWPVACQRSYQSIVVMWSGLDASYRCRGLHKSAHNSMSKNFPRSNKTKQPVASVKSDASPRAHLRVGRREI